jgi:hypothetical protein
LEVAILEEAPRHVGHVDTTRHERGRRGWHFEHLGDRPTGSVRMRHRLDGVTPRDAGRCE